MSADIEFELEYFMKISAITCIIPTILSGLHPSFPINQSIRGTFRKRVRIPTPYLACEATHHMVYGLVITAEHRGFR